MLAVATAISNAGVKFPQGWLNVVVQRQERVKVSYIGIVRKAGGFSAHPRAFCIQSLARSS